MGWLRNVIQNNKKKNKSMVSATVNGRTITVEGSSVRISGNKVFVDGKEIFFG